MASPAKILLLMLSCLIYSVSCQDNVNYDYYDYDVEAPTETKDSSTKPILIEIPLLEFPVKESILDSQQEMNTEAPIIETTTTKSKSKAGIKRKFVQPRRRPNKNLRTLRPAPVERPTKKVAEPKEEGTPTVTKEVKKSNTQNTRGRNTAGSSRFNRNRSRPSSSSSPSSTENVNSESSATTESSRRRPGRRNGGSRPSPTRTSSSQQQTEVADASTTSKPTSSSGRRSFRPRPSNRKNDRNSVTSTEAPESETTIASTHRFRGGSRPSSGRSRLSGRRSFEPSPVTTNDGPQDEAVVEEESNSPPSSTSSNSRFGRRG